MPMVRQAFWAAMLTASVKAGKWQTVKEECSWLMPPGSRCCCGTAACSTR
jgi:hypothetical protein